ncbi:trans-aconitate 2-methyltransferase [Cognatishimia sp. MH4019]|uniref:class I SAM-dependent methyltransferase n=1 Tax=Cognatishimia sp. MH4019 TaxID=2854030 RepID=UPI001CD5B1C1|nr:class I SAM-dependent methyltransferase [Cognatishimia sp. MH4019]
MAEKKLGPFKRALKEAEEKAGAIRVEEDGIVTHTYPDYETYRDVQVAGNKAKLRMQFVKESHIIGLSTYLGEIFETVDFGLCHGTRRGQEQAWFKAHLPGSPTIIGTEISDTADQFPDTIQWDFQDDNPDWHDKADFVYSNSWDHAYDPAKAFDSWTKSLKPGGVLLLDHTKGQTPDAANALDPVGATLDGLKTLLNRALDGQGEIRETLNWWRTNKEYRSRVVVWQKAS